ncbi:MAG: CDP-alcohol phosphatidyltransferase family protein [Muribaculaceae bacterium]|nr:CDP-alcohol phosphatidyltransferase family protein [Muribaculaceae bacterium]
MGKEKSERIQASILSEVEKSALVWLANRQPRWVTSDMLTFVGVIGAVICAIGYALSKYDLMWLWLSSFGLVINWYGDSLDGTLARTRNAQRPVYGFFIDHSLDAITICIMCIGAGFSPVFRMEIAMLLLIGYLVLSVYTYICTIIKDEFRLTYGGVFGPTELRLIIIILNTIVMYTNWIEINFKFYHYVFGIYDIVGILLASSLFGMWLQQFLKDRKTLDEIDPKKTSNLID